jgi:hypothetical protein
VRSALSSFLSCLKIQAALTFFLELSLSRWDMTDSSVREERVGEVVNCLPGFSTSPQNTVPPSINLSS